MMIRNNKIDVIKTCGSLLVVLAHMYTLPEWLHQLRNFDVVLLIIVSAILQNNKISDPLKDYNKVMKKRVLRIIMPTWTFLTFFFGSVLIYTKISHIEFPFTFKVVYESYSMINGIGYVWIMLVYVLMAIIGPLIIYFDERINIKRATLIIISIYILYELAVRISESLDNNIIKFIIQEILFYGIGYGFVYYIGVIWKRMNRNIRILFSTILLVLWIIVAIYYFLQQGMFVDSNYAKYPPTFYYLSYAIAISVLFIELVNMIRIPNILARFCDFIGRNSMWFYLWHILGIFLWNEIISKDCWYLMYAFVIFISIFITYIQVLIVNKFFTENRKFDFFIRTIFK